MSVAGIEGFLIGGFAGLLVRPVLDSYLAWRHMKASQTATNEVPTYPFLHEGEEEPNRWPT